MTGAILRKLGRAPRAPGLYGKEGRQYRYVITVPKDIAKAMEAQGVGLRPYVTDEGILLRFEPLGQRDDDLPQALKDGD